MTTQTPLTYDYANFVTIHSSCMTYFEANKDCDFGIINGDWTAANILNVWYAVPTKLMTIAPASLPADSTSGMVDLICQDTTTAKSFTH